MKQSWSWWRLLFSNVFANTYPAVLQIAGQQYLDAAPLPAPIIELNLANPATHAGWPGWAPPNGVSPPPCLCLPRRDDQPVALYAHWVWSRIAGFATLAAAQQTSKWSLDNWYWILGTGYWINPICAPGVRGGWKDDGLRYIIGGRYVGLKPTISAGFFHCGAFPLRIPQ